MHRYHDAGPEALDHQLRTFRADREHISDRHEQEVDPHELVRLHIVENMAQVSEMAEREAVHLEPV